MNLSDSKTAQYKLSLWPVAVYLTISMHFFGLVLMNVQATRTLFERLTPINLILSAFFLAFFQTDKNQRFWLVSLLLAVLGYLVEVLGVHTGLIFGHYWYDTNLGPHVFRVPPLIGLNWWLLVLASNSFWAKYLEAKWPRIILSAATMTFLDVLIEPFAMQRGLWSWQNDKVPFQNYAAWFAFSALFSAIFVYACQASNQQSNLKVENKYAPLLLFCTLLFFGLMLLV